MIFFFLSEIFIYQGKKIVEKAIKLTKEANVSQNHQQYFFLTVIIPHDLEDFKEVVDMLSECESLPLSVVFIGVGPYPFRMVQIEKVIGAKAKTKGIVLKRNIASFVDCKNYNIDTYEKVTATALQHLPDDIERVMMSLKIKPKHFSGKTALFNSNTKKIEKIKLPPKSEAEDVSNPVGTGAPAVQDVSFAGAPPVQDFSQTSTLIGANLSAPPVQVAGGGYGQPPAQTGGYVQPSSSQPIGVGSSGPPVQIGGHPTYNQPIGVGSSGPPVQMGGYPTYNQPIGVGSSGPPVQMGGYPTYNQPIGVGSSGPPVQMGGYPTYPQPTGMGSSGPPVQMGGYPTYTQPMGYAPQPYQTQYPSTGFPSQPTGYPPQQPQYPPMSQYPPQPQYPGYPQYPPGGY